MKPFRVFAFVVAVCCTAGGVAAEFPIEQSDHYTNFSIKLLLTDTVHRAQDQSMYITLPSRPNSNVVMLPGISLMQNGSGQPPVSLADRQSQALLRTLKSALSGYTLAPSVKQPADPLMLSVSVSAGEDSATFTFVKYHSSQWKKGAEIWNAARAALQPSQAATVPTL